MLLRNYLFKNAGYLILELAVWVEHV